MSRVSDIRTEDEIFLEERRESLRDWRWHRRRSMIGTAARWSLALVLAVGAYDSPPHLLSRLIAAL